MGRWGMKTFEEWWKSEMDGRSELPSGIVKIWSEESWNEARLGMVPADGVITVPDVSEWPIDAVGFYAFFC
jgi:hypothetical protein